MIVAPCLKVAAELAASRSDPKLFKDLPSMLCLMHLIESLGALHIKQKAQLNPMLNQAAISKAPKAACMMVLAEGGVDKEQSASLISSLALAYKKVLEAELTKACDDEIHKAWAALKDGSQEQFLALLEQAAKKFVVALDSWERTR
ncbi:MAG: hypothetical protein A6F71_01330 [Cycloclasticus sp. symbiont of Poecilosclerida sp. M]|nr:MAG: hypothetical protein A6F71_01330 [Cycloclasticus sp. symbiont of Poecilosclerida sp. M]